MALEVAALVARLSFESSGQSETLAAASAVERAVAQIGKTSTSTSAIVQQSGDRIVTTLRAWGDEQERLVAISEQHGVALRDLALGTEGLNNALASAVERQEQHNAVMAAAVSEGDNLADALQSAVSAFGEESVEAARATAALEEQTSIMLGLENQATSLTAEVQNLLAAQEALAAEGGSRGLRAFQSDVEKATNSAANFTKGTVRGTEEVRKSFFRMNATTLTSLSRLVRSGQVGNALVAQLALGFGRIGGIAGVAAIGVGQLAAAFAALVIISVAVFFAKIASAAFKAHDSLALISDDVLRLADSLGEVRGANRLEVAGMLEDMARGFAAIGATNPDQLAANIVEWAESLQFLNSVPGDIGAAQAALEQLITTGSTSGLAAFDIDRRKVDEVVAAYQEAGRGYEAGLQGAIEVQRQLADAQDRVAEGARAEGDTFAYVAQQIKAAIDSVGQSQEVEDAITGIVEEFKKLIPLVKELAPLLGVVLIGAIKGVTLALRVMNIGVGLLLREFSGLVNIIQEAHVVFQEITSLGTYNRELDPFIKDTDKLINETKELAESLIKGTAYVDDFTTATDGAEESLGSIIPTAQQATEAIRAFFAQRTEGAGFFNQLGDIAQGFRDIEDGATGKESLDLILSLDAAIGNLVENGTGQIERLWATIQELSRQGLVPPEALESLKAVFDTGVAAAQPLIDAANKVTENVGIVDSVSDDTAATMRESLTPSIQGTIGAISDATTAAEGYKSALEAIPSQVSTNIYIGASGPGYDLLLGGVPSSFSSGGTRPPAAHPRGGRPPTTINRPTVGASTTSTIRSGHQGSRKGARSRTPDDVDTSVGRLTRAISNSADSINSIDYRKLIDPYGNAFLGPRRGGGGGGGGSSAKDDRDATIEDIRAFFNQVNKAILGGIRGGLSFSLAGNAIPLGGPGQFVSSKGDTLIEQVNLRGVWDFADPAAKREVVRQLREALAEIGNEVA